jgi:ATP-dependent DNA helicase Rep
VGPLLVLAGAGSGKTRVITYKIAHLLGACGCDANTVFAVTFTNRAAREMKSRLSGMLGPEQVKTLSVSTFHSLGLRILREHAREIGLRRGFSIIDAADAALVVRELTRSELTAERSLSDRVKDQISRWKNDLVTPSVVDAAAGNDPVTAAAARIYADYERRLRACNVVDLDDLVLAPILLFRQRPEVLDRWQARVAYLLVDEYQDTNASQYELVKLLVGEGRGLTAVGDDDQSIYAWRGAQPENLETLTQDFPDLTVVKLEQNYRSTGRILHAANTLIANNPRPFEKNLWSELGHGDPIDVVIGRNEEHEAERVVSRILHHRFQHNTAYGDYAILYRGNHQSRWFELKLREMRIPYYLSGQLSFFDRAEIKDVMAYLRLLTNPGDDNAFLRVVNTPRRGIGTQTLEKLGRIAAAADTSLFAAISQAGIERELSARQTAPLRLFADWLNERADALLQADPVDLVQGLLDDMGYEDWLRNTAGSPRAAENRWNNVRELVAWLGRLSRAEPRWDLPDLVAALTLMDMLDEQDEGDGNDMVSLMTLHAAKGLEFPYVFVTGVEEDLLPHRSSLVEESIAEERRLFYVGITRAQRRLSLSMARQRRRYQEVAECQPSRFIDELPAQDLNWLDDRGLQVEGERQQLGQAHLENLRALLR